MGSLQKTINSAGNMVAGATNDYQYYENVSTGNDRMNRRWKWFFSSDTQWLVYSVSASPMFNSNKEHIEFGVAPDIMFQWMRVI